MTDLPEETREAVDVLTAEVVASFDDAPDRLRQLTQDLVRHLHAFVLDNDVTQEEWRFAIDFLTRAGHITTDVRQEFILLSDTLGVSSLVDILSNSRTPESTPSAVLGPFYVEGPPELPDGADISGGLEGEPVQARIAVTDTAGRPVADAVVDVWQSNQDGFYDVQLPDLDGPVLRGRLRTDDAGRITFTTILPSPYPIPDDGPVGQMLAATGRHPMRAPHVHFMIAAEGKHTLITQLFVEGGEYLDSDTVFGVKEPIIVPFPADGSGTYRTLDFTFVLADADRSSR
ncbi:hydroxyquinol 1,2-dioxygenase [Nocardioides mangrovicus]|uniref:Hydroxyquinol 1,2-dioxygenase n=1 Tax=Nocardioides mangrovicus TaxID=2478913 RepID=A0A3L8P6W7_9ACTN|nr:dioxygenase [Nocardioides mangrovicus]RLV50955.1 hydroxyquinol 1,2-dioxygenase [Nocardioides mangrovicus]